MDPKRLIDKTVAEIKAGRLDNFSPLIGLFQYERKPMTLDGHFMFLPLFSLECPKFLTLQCGRQVSKSFTLSETLILTTGMIESFNSLYIAPRYDQLRRFHNQVLSPMLRTSGIADLFLNKAGSDAIEMKSFQNGNTLMLEHSFSSPDRTRGASGVGRVCCDESVSGETKIAIYHLTDTQDGVYYISDRPDIAPITEVKQGDIVMSFTENGCIYSPVVRDASYHGRRAIFKVTTKSGRILRCTVDHRIHTNLGSMRLSDVIEYCCNSGDGEETSTTGRDERLCSECGGGDDPRGCACTQTPCEGERKLLHKLEPRHQTERLSGVQSDYIVRVRNASSVCEAESRLRRLLGETANKNYKDIYIACADDLSYTEQPENNNAAASGFVDGADRAGTVVWGRRESKQESQRWNNSDERFRRAGGNAVGGMASGALGYRHCDTACETFEHRQTSLCNRIDQNRVHTNVGTGFGPSTRQYEVQTGAKDTRVSSLSQNVPAECMQSLLLRSVQREIPENSETRILRENERCSEGARAGVRGEIPRGAQRRDKRKAPSCIRGNDTRTEGSQSSIRERISTDTQRCAKCSETSSACGKEGRSGVREEAEGRAPTLLSEEKGGPGATQTGLGAGTKKQQKTGAAGATARVPTEIQSRTSGYIPSSATTFRSSSKSSAADRSGIQRSCECDKTCIHSKGCRTEEGCGRGFIYDRIVSIVPDGEEDVYDIEVVGTHNYILANGMCSYNCQDINPDFLPVFESTTDASKFGIIQCAGTSKTSDTLLALQFGKSSQCHWGIKCPHCGKWNIADIEEQLIQMIGKDGLSCYSCGKILNPRTGGWVPKFPERHKYHAGYHVPQIILPMHCENEVKWKVLRSRQSDWSRSRFFNEVLGTDCDESVKILTKEDLISAQNNFENNLDAAIRNRKLFDTVFIGVDWSGGGGGFSRTAISAIGRSAGHRESHVFYLETLPHGLTPEEEADRVAAIFSKLRANMVAHDYTGAGFVRESVLLGRHPYLQDKIYPFAYVFRTGSQLVSYADSGSRRSANVDKTRSLLLTFNSIRSKLLMLPKFDPFNNSEPVFELLNIVERPQEFSKATIKDVYILQRAPGRYDDAAHAINIAFIAQCDLTDSWPQFTMDPKYNMTDAQLEAITGKHDEVRL